MKEEMKKAGLLSIDLGPGDEANCGVMTVTVHVLYASRRDGVYIDPGGMAVALCEEECGSLARLTEAEAGESLLRTQS